MKAGGDKDGFWTLFESGLLCVSVLVHRCVSDIPFRSIGAVTAQVPYVVPILDILTGKNGTIPRVRAFGRERVFKRLEAGASRKDLFYHLVL
jgi:hypothetical protein